MPDTQQQDDPWAALGAIPEQQASASAKPAADPWAALGAVPEQSGGQTVPPVSQPAAPLPVDTVRTFYGQQRDQMRAVPLTSASPSTFNDPAGARVQSIVGNPPPASQRNSGQIAASQMERFYGPDHALVDNYRGPIKTIGNAVDQIRAGKSYVPVATAPVADPANPRDLAARNPMSYVGGGTLPEGASEADRQQQLQQAGDTLGSPVTEPLRGVGQIADVLGQDIQNPNRKFFGGQAPSDAERHEAAQGGLRVAGGLFGADTLGTAPAVAKVIGQAFGGDLASSLALGKMVAEYGAGAGASYGVGKVADDYGLDPDTKAVLQTSAFLFPGLAANALMRGAAAAGVKSAVGVDADGNQAAGVRSPSGNMRAGVRVTPDAYEAGAQVGDRQFNFRVPRTPDPAQVAGQQMLSDSLQAMQDSAKADAAAKLIVQGHSPADAIAAQEPPKQPTMQEQAATELFPNAVIPAQFVTHAAEVVRSIPPDQQGAAILQAHQSLAAQIAKWPTFVGPDGKAYNVKNPSDALKYASQFINEAVDDHDTKLQAQQEAAQPPVQPTPSKGQSKLQQAKADRDYGRAKTIIESSSSPEEAYQTGQRAGMSDQQMQQHLARYQAENTPTVGSPEEPVVQESPATIDKQVDALRAGTIKAVMLPEGSKYRPQLPPGMKVVSVTNGPGSGLWLYDPTKLNPQTIREAAQNGSHGALLGHVQGKADLAEAGKPTAAIVARDPNDGTEIQASEVNNPQAAQAQAQTLAERHPNADITAEPVDRVLGERLALQEAPQSQVPTEASTKDKDGAPTEVYARDEKHPGTYRLVESDNVQPSHDHQTFSKNPNHPGNQRDYEKTDAKGRVVTQAQNLDPKYLVTDNPDAVNGPPIVEPNGVVLGGNSRAMSIKRAYALHPEKAEGYRKALVAQADKFGLPKDATTGMKQPMLVREIAPSKDEKERESRVAAFNETKTAALTPGEEAVSNGRKLDQETMSELSRLIDATGETASIRDMLREHGLDAIHLFEKAGVITEQQRPKYVENSQPSEAGKDLIENAILGKVVDDAKLMDTTPKAVLNNLDNSLAAITAIDSESDEFNIIPLIRDALDQHAEVSKRKTNVQAFQQQTGLMEQRVENPAVDAIVRKLVEKPRDVKLALRGFAADVKDGRLGQGSLIGAPPAASDAFNQAFGTKLTEGEYADALARGVSEKEPRAEESRSSERDSSLQSGGPGRPEAAGTRGADRGDGGLRSPARGEGSGALDEPEPRYKFGSVQHNLEASSPASKAVEAVRARIKEADLSGDGKDAGSGGNHVTVRYGLSALASAQLREFIRSQAPFEAKLVKIDAFPPGPNSDGASPLIAPVESLELHRINGEIDRHDDFEPSTFPEYKPHITIAYIKPDAVDKYVGDTATEGKTFMVRSIAVGDRDGNQEEVQLEGKSSVKQSPQNFTQADLSKVFTPQKEDRIRYRAKDGTEKTGVYKAQFGPELVRIAPDGGGKPDIIKPANMLGPISQEALPLAHYDENAFYNRQGKTSEQFAQTAHFTLIPGAGNEAPSVHVTPDAYQLLRQMPVFGRTGQWSGVSIDANSAFDLRKQLQNFAAKADGSAKENALALRAALAGDKFGNVIIVHQGAAQGVMQEEQFHGFQQREGMVLGTRNEFKDLPGYLKAEEVLKSKGYGLTPQEHLAAEVTAQIAAGFGDDLNISREEQAGILAKFFKVAVQKNGPDVLERIPQMAAEWMYPKTQEVSDGDSSIEQRGSGRPAQAGGEALGRASSSGNDAARPSIQEQLDSQPAKTTDGGSAEGSERDAAGDSSKLLFSRSAGLKPESKLKVADSVKALIGDEAERVAVSRDIHNRLYDLGSQDDADTLRAIQMLKQMPGSAKDQEAIYHHLEDPQKLPLTEVQQTILDDYLTPLIYQAEHDFQVVTDGGVPLENYVHRQVRDRGGMIDRIMEKVKEGKPSTGSGGGRLTKTAPASKHRSMMAIENAKTGARNVVSIKGGRVTVLEKGKEPRDLGALAKGMTKVGAEAEAQAAPYVKQVTDLRDEIAGAKSADHAEQLQDVQDRIADLDAQHELLDGVKARMGTTSPGTPDLYGKNGARPVYSKEATFHQRAEITRKLDELRKREEAIKNGTAPMLAKNVMKLYRRKESLKDAEAARDHFLNELPADTFTDGAWKGNDGQLYRIKQATTKEIESDTDLSYHHHAAASVVVNYLQMSKARRAYEFLEQFKSSPEFAQVAASLDSPGHIPSGWRATQLPQLRNYHFEPHVAEVLDFYAKRIQTPEAFAKAVQSVEQFLVSVTVANPLMHMPNIGVHFLSEKGATGLLNPTHYLQMSRAGVKAFNAVIHQNADFLEALDAGAPFMSQRYAVKQFGDIFVRKMQEELKDPDSSKVKELAKAIGMSPITVASAIGKFSGDVTWTANDIAFLQAAYEKQEFHPGMSLSDALRETGRHLPNYRLPTRIFNLPALAQVLSNSHIFMFSSYHYGMLKGVGQMLKSIAGANWRDAGTKNAKGEPTNRAGHTRLQEQAQGVNIALALALIAAAYKVANHVLKSITGNDKAELRMGGQLAFANQIYLLLKHERTIGQVAQSVATPALLPKTALELLTNHDFYTGQRIYNGAASKGVIAQQVGRKIGSTISPLATGLQIAEGQTDIKKMAYSMVGVDFPLHGADKVAVMLNAENLAGKVPDDEATRMYYIKRSRALHAAWAGDKTKLQEFAYSTKLTHKERKELFRDSLESPLAYEVKHLSYDEMTEVRKVATSDQKKILDPLMNKKWVQESKEGKRPKGEAYPALPGRP